MSKHRNFYLVERIDAGGAQASLGVFSSLARARSALAALCHLRQYDGFKRVSSMRLDNASQNLTVRIVSVPYGRIR